MSERRITTADGRYAWLSDSGALRTTLDEWRKSPNWRKNLESVRRIREAYEARSGIAASGLDATARSDEKEQSRKP